MDKRDLNDVFRQRLEDLIARFPGNRTKFAQSIGLDRSALSQLLSDKTVRLPRAETLRMIAEAHQVSLDWLLGLSQSETLAAEIAPTLEIEEEAGDGEETRLAQWHREASGYKIRYVPSLIPDFLRTPAVIEYEHQEGRGPRAETQIRQAGLRIAYNRQPETDMEVCMPRQSLETFARGEGLWSGLETEVRREQLGHMANLLGDLYPTVRMFLYDGFVAFSAPYTVFGPLRASIYVGDMYLVLNANEHIRALTRHFDNLIKVADINPHEAEIFVRGLCAEAAA